MIIQQEELLKLDSRYRANMINSLAGIKQLVLIGTQSASGISNLAAFNSLIHIGANPPLYGFISRPDTVQRDTLQNILDTKEFTFNYVNSEYYEKAHQSSAKYPTDISEFDAVGFNKEYVQGCFAPFIKDAIVKIGLKFEERIDLKINGTILIIGSLHYIEFNENLISTDGFVALEKASVLSCSGLDAYYETRFISRLSYAKPDKWPVKI